MEVFKYLGQLMTMDDMHTQAIRSRGNLTKTKACTAWKMISRLLLLRSENMKPRVCGMFFKAVVQVVLLYGSETWVLTDSASRCLEGFFYRAACRMASKNRPKKNEQTGEWTHPDKKEGLIRRTLKFLLYYYYLKRLGCIL